MNKRWFEIIPAAPETAILMIGFQFLVFSMSSLDASYSKTNTPNGAFVSFPAGVFRAFCRSPLFTNKFEGVVFEHVFPIIIEPSFFEDATTACAHEPTRETLEEEDLETFVCNHVFQKEERRDIALRKKERKKDL